jgi:malonyl-ACP decarboxylase
MPICIALGALQDVSELELQAFASLGAMASCDKTRPPTEVCRPFDADHGGFVYGENCAALVVESLLSAQVRGVRPLARIVGTGVVMDAQRGVHPSLEGEVQAMALALAEADWSPRQVDLISPHGTGSKVGDGIEVQALQQIGLSHAWINTTKSITGHGLGAAGAVELVATVLQLQQQTLHPCLNLSSPIADMHWVHSAGPQCVSRALSLSLGFGGINTAVCLETVA